MRWLWIDRIVEFEPGRRLAAVKNVSLAEEHLHDHFAAMPASTSPVGRPLDPLPVMPASLIIEGMAQTAGILVGSVHAFREKVILAKIMAARIDADVQPGQTIRYEATLDRIDGAGASTSGVVRRCIAADGAWEAIGQVDLLFSHVDHASQRLDIPEHNFVFGDNFRMILQQGGLVSE